MNSYSLTDLFSKKSTIIILTVIGIISFSLKIYLADFTTPVFSDAQDYTQHAIAFSEGQFLQHPQRYSGWPLFQSIFIYFLDSENFLDYSNISKILSMIISTLTIIPMYLLAHRYFDSRFSLIAVGIFAFEPRLIQNSILGFSEPFFIILITTSIYLITKTENKYLLFSFFLAGILWWIRPNGFVLLITISIIYFFRFKFSFHSIRNFIIYFLISALIISPLLLQRYEQFGDPMYTWIGDRIWIGDYSHSRSLSFGEPYSAINFIDDNGFQNFLETFLFKGIISLSSSLSYMMIPFLLILTPLGMILSFKKGIVNTNLISVWGILLISLLLSIIPFSVIPDKRLLLFLFPFLIIFSILPIKYFFEKYYFLQKKNKIFFILIFTILIITSSIMVSRYEKSDPLLEQEKINFTKFVLTNFEGKLLFEPNNSQKYFNHPMLDSNYSNFKSIKITEKWKDGDPYFNYPEQKLIRISVFGNDIQEFMNNAQKAGLTHIMVTSDATSFFNFINEIYYDDEKYSFLKKVYDSSSFNHKKFHVKVFEINYLEFNNLKFTP